MNDVLKLKGENDYGYPNARSNPRTQCDETPAEMARLEHPGPGGILFIPPWLFGTASQTSSSWNAWIVGIGLGVFTWRTLLPPPGGYANKCAHEGVRIAWWQRVLDTCKLSHIAKEQIVVGAWMLVAPWVLGFAAIGAAAWPAWIAGIVIVILAVWKLQEFRSQ